MCIPQGISKAFLDKDPVQKPRPQAICGLAPLNEANPRTNPQNIKLQICYKKCEHGLNVLVHIMKKTSQFVYFLKNIQYLLHFSVCLLHKFQNQISPYRW